MHIRRLLLFVLYRLVGINGQHGTHVYVCVCVRDTDGRTRVKNFEARTHIMKDEFMCERAYGMRIIIIMSNNDKQSGGRIHD